MKKLKLVIVFMLLTTMTMCKTEHKKEQQTKVEQIGSKWKEKITITREDTGARVLLQASGLHTSADPFWELTATIHTHHYMKMMIIYLMISLHGLKKEEKNM